MVDSMLKMCAMKREQSSILQGQVTYCKHRKTLLRVNGYPHKGIKQLGLLPRLTRSLQDYGPNHVPCSF